MFSDCREHSYRRPFGAGAGPSSGKGEEGFQGEEELHFSFFASPEILDGPCNPESGNLMRILPKCSSFLWQRWLGDAVGHLGGEGNLSKSGF